MNCVGQFFDNFRRYTLCVIAVVVLALNSLLGFVFLERFFIQVSHIAAIDRNMKIPENAIAFLWFGGVVRERASNLA